MHVCFSVSCFSEISSFFILLKRKNIQKRLTKASVYVIIIKQSDTAVYGPVVQLVRTLACHARGRRFDPVPDRQFAPVAQSVEQGTENPCVDGSIPSGST